MFLRITSSNLADRYTRLAPAAAELSRGDESTYNCFSFFTKYKCTMKSCGSMKNPFAKSLPSALIIAL
jgi:hypothetical protein